MSGSGGGVAGFDVGCLADFRNHFRYSTSTHRISNLAFLVGRKWNRHYHARAFPLGSLFQPVSEVWSHWHRLGLSVLLEAAMESQHRVFAR